VTAINGLFTMRAEHLPERRASRSRFERHFRPTVLNMNNAAAWNLRGIGYETRLAAEQAARLAGMSLGEWLEDIIAQQAAADAEQDGPGAVNQDAMISESKAVGAPSTNSRWVASKNQNGGGRTLHALRASKRANENEHAISMALVDRIEALEKRLASHFAGEAPSEGGAPPLSRGDRFRAPSATPPSGPGQRSNATRRPSEFEANRNSSAPGWQSDQTEMKKIKSTVHAMHRLLEVISRKLAGVEDDAGYTRRFLEARDPEIGIG
jgi:hypothetical protein